jgi:hypothetical protein
MPAEQPMSSAAYRCSVVGTVLVAFVAMSVLYRYGDANLYYQILKAWGIVPFRFPFLDISQSLAAWECTRQGFDVMMSNPCDVLNRSYIYSPIWIAAAGLPLGVANTPVVGWSLGLLFVSSLYLLPAPRSGVELALTITATLSTMVVYALERANADILLFMMALAASFLAEGRVAGRLLGYGVALTAALIKYYPIMVLIIVVRERIVTLCTVLAAVLFIFAAFWVEYHADIAKSISNIPHGAYNADLFAAQNLPFLIGEAIGNATASQLVGRLASLGLYIGLLSAAAAISYRLWRWIDLRAALASLPQREQFLLVIGSAVIAGCFFAGQSVGYRGVYLLMVMPGLLALARRASRELRFVALSTIIIIVLLIWGECLRVTLYNALGRAAVPDPLGTEIKFQFWLVRELGWWWIISVMLVAVAEFLHASPIVRDTLLIFDRVLTKQR